MNALRKTLYAAARFLGDVRAVLAGRILRRLVNKLIGRGLVSRMWR